ncbi:MAG TPA: L-histidine N(alpha)-methyltransferase [Thermoanaerobaculia bacterium]|nr:L-histidine N(alpha)-methyltransferase [Thermoanaerobaculia bacterium]
MKIDLTPRTDGDSVSGIEFRAIENDRFVLHRISQSAASFAEDVRHGFTASPKWLLARWLYDDLGSALFDAITFLPEYYVTRAESEILRSRAPEIARAFGDNIRLVELGSGSARKTRMLLDQLTMPFEYVPVDIDPGMLEKSAHDLLNEYPEMRITAVCADFTRPAEALSGFLAGSQRNVVLFLGSTIGNLDPDSAVAMLRGLRGTLKSGDALFLGADLRKSPDILIPAYDDALGVTAAFDLNLLVRINRELGGHFALDAFAHRARWDDANSRIEMHLESRRTQRVRIDALALDVTFAEGETIHTESSYKYSRAALESLAAAAGFTVEQTWTDEAERFADVLMVAG